MDSIPQAILWTPYHKLVAHLTADPGSQVQTPARPHDFHDD